VALVNVRVFDGYLIQKPSTVIMDGDVICTDAENIDSVVDGQGGILIPGLIDSHCHPASIAELEALSSFGVTTAMSMSCPSYPLCESLRNQVGLTSFFTGGRAATAPNSSHAILFNVPKNELVSSPSQAPQFVANVFNNGSDFMKLVAESNGLDQNTQNALVAETHKLGKKAMTHAADFHSYNQAIISKTNGIQHIPLDKTVTHDMIKQIQRQNQYITPTLTLGKILLNTSTSSNPNVSYANARESVRLINEAHIPILAGTDSTSQVPWISIPFGKTLHDEMANLVDAGLTPAEALRSATLVAARLHDLHDRGVIAPGKRADLVLLKDDPLANISATRSILRVWNGGIEYTAISSTVVGR
jgi:imidazolonepropionase-like amidohydrolase